MKRQISLCDWYVIGDNMKRNMGAIDRSVRALVGVALIVIGFLTGLWWLYIIAAIMLLTSAIAICPLYKPFKLNTMSRDERDRCCSYDRSR